MDKKFQSSIPEIWGGIECTINRVGDSFRDQCGYSGHYSRQGDLEAIASLGISKIRYPLLWEKHVTSKQEPIDWGWSTEKLNQIRSLDMQPIAGLIHHGSGPAFTDLLEPDFPELLASYAEEVARKFPWIEYYTPINEPLTTARFSGLYGLWYPHHRNDSSFAKMVVNQCKAIVLSMQAIRRINPDAKLVQTEDLGKTYSTPKLAYQARFENRRRWLSYDLLCGKINKRHGMWRYLIHSGITEQQLNFFIENPCKPQVMGFNYYITSERFLDHEIEKYPSWLVGGNGQHRYADIEAARVEIPKQTGLLTLLKEAWKRFGIPIAITEVHIGCTREEQIRWFYEVWNTSLKAKEKGIDIVAVTPWSMLGSYDWNSLLTHENLHYEAGVFDVRGNRLRPTALARVIESVAKQGSADHPLLLQKGWWHRSDRFLKDGTRQQSPSALKGKPLLIIGKSGTLANAFTIIAAVRSIPVVCLSRNEVDILDPLSLITAIDKYKPWGVVNCAGYVNVDKAEVEKEKCMQINATAPAIIASVCRSKNIPFMTFSSDLVFGGDKSDPYLEDDEVNPVNIYGQSKVLAEEAVLKEYGQTLIIRSSAFFGPWDKFNFVYSVLRSLEKRKELELPGDVIVSPTYVPDLVNASLDLFIDEANGIWHITNNGSLSWADFAKEVARQAVFNEDSIIAKDVKDLSWYAQRPVNSALASDKGIGLPSLDNAIERYFKDVVTV